VALEQIDGVDQAALDEVVERSRGVVDRTTERLLDRILSASDVRRVYGEPIVEGDRTIVPVASVRSLFGVGGGSGHGPKRWVGGEGGGGGGAVDMRPVGYLEVTPSGARFVPIVDVGRRVMIGTVVTGMVALVVAWRWRR
jgi:uncharacterized spore protein YtfJ